MNAAHRHRMYGNELYWRISTLWVLSFLKCREQCVLLAGFLYGPMSPQWGQCQDCTRKMLNEDRL